MCHLIYILRPVLLHPGLLHSHGWTCCCAGATQSLQRPVLLVGGMRCVVTRDKDVMVRSAAAEVFARGDLSGQGPALIKGVWSAGVPCLLYATRAVFVQGCYGTTAPCLA
jgi:hypothetical protein